jgi:hypothetical protein
MLSRTDVAGMNRAGSGDIIRASDDRAAIWEHGQDVVVDREP